METTRLSSEKQKKMKGYSPILMYHEVSNNPERQRKIRRFDPNYSLKVQQFEEQMAYLYENGYKTVSPDEIIAQQINDRKQCLLTFDDGFIGNYEFAYPILQKYQYSAIFFISIKHLHPELFMNWNQLRELVNNGFSIQSHTMTHPALRYLSEKEIFYELAESKKIIEKELGKEVKYLSLPLGSYKKSVFRIADEIGYVGIFTSSLYSKDLTSKPVKIGRIAIKAGYNKNIFHNIITKNPKLYYKLKSESLIKNTIKKIVGSNNYRRIYRFVHRIEIV